MDLAVILFLAGVLTILLPCILPLVPIVVGVNIAGKSPLRPLIVALGMLLGFVGFTFLLHVLLSQFVTAADMIRIGSYAVLLLLGFGFAFRSSALHVLGALIAALFFWPFGILAVLIALIVCILAVLIAGQLAGRVQQLGSDIQTHVRGRFGGASLLTAFIIGITMGLVWVPCAGPALAYALTLVRERPSAEALLLLTSYGVGAAFPLLLIGFLGQKATSSVRFLTRFSGSIEVFAGIILILTAVSLRFGWLRAAETWFVQHTTYGTFGTRLEERLFPDLSSRPSFSSSMPLPKIVRAPELQGLGPWHNSEPLTLKDLKGKVVLLDFWTYSCINCIRTLPHIQGYWETFGSTELTTGKDQPFVLIGVHSPEFVFEKSEANVADAIRRHGLTYPVAQDNDFATWGVFANRYWPAKYLIDAEGYIRYTHFGEGAYEETEEAIRSLLKEIGVPFDGAQGEQEEDQGSDVGGQGDSFGRLPQSPETYLGERSWPAFANGIDVRVAADGYAYEWPASKKVPLHKYALVGTWELIDGERQVLRSNTGEIRMTFLGAEMNLVLGLEDGAASAQAEVFIDGKKTDAFTVDRDDLYVLYKGSYGEHEMVLKLKGKGVEGYAFTFGQ